MHTEESLRKMTPHELSKVIDDLSLDDARHVLCFLAGWAPDGLAAALNSVERVHELVADRIVRFVEASRSSPDE